MEANLNLVLTYKCNLSCRHCLADCSPARGEAMSFHQARQYIDDAVAATNVTHVGYTGGEPFLYYTLLRELMAYTSRAYGLPQGVVTNCSWAAGPQMAENKLQELRDCGLRHLTVSCDDYHLEYTPPERIEWVVRAGLELGLQVTINVVVTQNGTVCKTDVPGLLALAEADLDRVHIKEFSPLLIGRAANQVAEKDLIGTDQEAAFNGICPFVIRTPAIAPNGAFYACCCFGDAEVRPAEKIAYVGDASQRPLEDLFRAMEGDLLLNLLSQRGPYSVLLLLQQYTPGLHIRGRYMDNCEVCWELYHNHRVRRALAEFLPLLVAQARGDRA